MTEAPGCPGRAKRCRSRRRGCSSGFRCPLSTLEKVNSPGWSGSPWNRSSSGWSLLRVVSPRTPGGASGPYRRRLPPGPPTAVPPPHRQYSRAHTAQHTVLRIQRRLRRIRVVRQRVVVPGETSRAEITCKSNPTTREALIPAGRHRSCASFLFLVVVNPGKRSLPATFRSWPSGLRPVSGGVSCRFQVPLRSVKVDGGRGQAARPGPQGRGRRGRRLRAVAPRAPGRALPVQGPAGRPSAAVFSRSGAAYSSGWGRSFGFCAAGRKELTAGSAVFVLVIAGGAWLCRSVSWFSPLLGSGSWRSGKRSSESCFPYEKSDKESDRHTGSPKTTHSFIQLLQMWRKP